MGAFAGWRLLAHAMMLDAGSHPYLLELQRQSVQDRFRPQAPDSCPKGDSCGAGYGRCGGASVFSFRGASAQLA